MDWHNDCVGYLLLYLQVSIVFATKLKSFTFLPVLKKLPTENRVKSVWEKGSSKLSEVSIIIDAGSTHGTYLLFLQKV